MTISAKIASPSTALKDLTPACGFAHQSHVSRLALVEVDDGIRTRDRRDHNAELYQLSYVHRARLNLAVAASSLGRQLVLVGAAVAMAPAVVVATLAMTGLVALGCMFAAMG